MSLTDQIKLQLYKHRILWKMIGWMWMSLAVAWLVLGAWYDIPFWTAFIHSGADACMGGIHLLAAKWFETNLKPKENP
jgi:hypothetical protein